VACSENSVIAIICFSELAIMTVGISKIELFPGNDHPIFLP
jgi:hypothetical protein